MTLVELLVSMTLTAIAVAGTISATLLFAKIANNHENYFDNYRETRDLFEQLAHDTRNASSVSSRTSSSFTFTYQSASPVVYTYNGTAKTLTRTVDSESSTMLSNLTVFDLLVDATDAQSNPSLDFDADQIAIETIKFEATNGTAPESILELNNFTFTLRNG